MISISPELAISTSGYGSKYIYDKFESYKARILDYKNRMSQTEMDDIIKAMIKLWPRDGQELVNSGSQLMRRLLYKKIAEYNAYYVRMHKLQVWKIPSYGINENNAQAPELFNPHFGMGVPGSAASPYTFIAGETPYTLAGAVDAVIGTNFKTRFEPEVLAEITKTVKYWLKEWTKFLDADDTSNYNEMIRTDQIRANTDNWILGVRQDVFTAGFETVTQTALAAAVIAATAGAAGAAVPGVSAGGVTAAGSAVGSGTLAGSTGLLTGAAEVTTLGASLTGAGAASASATAGLSLGASGAITTGLGAATTTGLLATLTTAAESAIGATLVNQAKSAINNLINPPKSVETPVVSQPNQTPSSQILLYAGLAGALALLLI